MLASRSFVLGAALLLAGCASTGTDCVIDTDCAIGRYCGEGQCLLLGTEPGTGGGGGGGGGGDCLRGPGGVCLDRDGSAGGLDGSTGGDVDGSSPNPADGSVVGDRDGSLPFFDAGRRDGSTSSIEDAAVDASGPPPTGVRREGEVVAESVQWRTVDDRDPPRTTLHRRRAARAELYETEDITACTRVGGSGACSLFQCDRPPRQTPRSAGPIEISAAATVTLPPNADGYAAQSSGSEEHWAPAGGTVRFQAPGSYVPPFDESLPAPEQVQITAPDFRSSVSVNLNAGTDFRWNSVANGEVVVRIQGTAAAFEGLVECRFPASAGRGRVVLGLIAIGIPAGTAGELHVYNEVSRDPGLPASWDVTLRAQAPAVYSSDSRGSTRELSRRSVSLR